MKPLKNRRVTITDVAEAAHVSISTVSKVMNGTGYVSGEITERVKRVIEQTGYVPDSIARSLKYKYRYLVGYVVSDITNRHFTLISKKIEDVLAQEGFNLIVCSTASCGEREKKVLEALLANRVDGLIINTSGENDELIAQISRNIPVLLLHRRIAAQGFSGDQIGNDNYSGSKELARHLVKKGHKKIGLITSDLRISTFADRTAGFTDGLAQAGEALAPESIITADYSEKGGETAIADLLAKSPDITAVGIMNNAVAIGTMDYLRRNGIPVPGQLSVVTYGEILHSDLFYTKPVFISQQPELVGEQAANLILNRIHNLQLAPVEEIVPTVFIPGDSVKDIS